MLVRNIQKNAEMWNYSFIPDTNLPRTRHIFSTCISEIRRNRTEVRKNIAYDI